MGASATGPFSLPPVAYATSFHTPGVASNANVTNVLTTGMIVDRASFTTGYSLVNSPLVQLNYVLARIQASQISSWCHIVGRFAVGGSYIYNGSVQQNGSTVFNPLQNPAPITVVKIYGATVIFNAHTFSAGRLTVSAIKVISGPESLSLGVTSWRRAIWADLAGPLPLRGRTHSRAARAPVRGPAPSVCPGHPALPPSTT